jgi:hypothetical protein
MSRPGISTLIILCLFGLCFAQSPTSRLPADRETRWLQDLKFFSDEFPARHKDFAKLYHQPAFNNELDALRNDISKLDDAEITLRLMRLVATANVGHTNIYLPGLKQGFDRLPITLTWYSDRLAVTRSAPLYSAALGARVLLIGRYTPEQLLDSLAPYIAHENVTWLKQQSTSFLVTLQVLRHLGVVREDGGIDYTLAKSGGKPFTITVKRDNPVVVRDQVSVVDALHIPMALYRKHPDSYYWYEYLDDSKALYVQYNRCANDPKLAFKDFAAEVLAFADEHPVERVIIDLRFNGGGNSIVIWPLMSGLRKRDKSGSHLYVLIGPSTFSSAQNNAIEFRNGSHATLVGESTGEKPNGYGEVKTITLPNSGLTVQYCTEFFLMVKDADPSALEPDIKIGRTLDDVLAGRDPVLDTALQHKPKS